MRKLISAICVCLLLISSLNSYALAENVAETYSEIALGSKGSEVSALQTRLKELGYYTKSIDGDYGNGTKTAVASFQVRNNLTSNGIASAETVAAIYSEEAIPAPKVPALSITSVKKGDTTNVTVCNNLDVTVDRVDFKVITYDAGGNVHGFNKFLDTSNLGLTGQFEVSGKTISPGHSVLYELDTYDDVDNSTKFIGVYIDGYHTVDGKDYDYHPSQVYVYKSDNSIEYPIDESDPDCMADADINRANTIKLGVAFGSITTWLSPLYMYPVGDLLLTVIEGSIFDLAGLKAEDVIKSFDEIDALSGHSWEYAKARMLAGETVTVHYWRNSKEYTTQIAQDMDKLMQENAVKTESTVETPSIADQLQSIVDLYEKGLLTAEEYAAAKAKILG